MSDTEGAPEGETESQRIVRATKSVYFNALQVEYGYAVTLQGAGRTVVGCIHRSWLYIAGGYGYGLYRWLYIGSHARHRRPYLFNPTVEIK